MRLLHVIPHVGAEASGPTYTTLRLTQALARDGHEVRLLSVLDGRVPPAPCFSHDVYPRARLLPGLWRSPELWQALRESAPTADVVHAHGMWMMPNVYPGWLGRVSSAPLVISPHGTLSPWALGHSRWKKKVAWALLQGKVVKNAACLHATADEEYRELRRLGLRQPICVIPNGVDVPDLDAPELAAPVRDAAGRGLAGHAPAERTLLYMGRLHEKKGIDRLLRAWAMLADERPGWCLRIVGPDDGGHELQLRRLVAALDAPRVTFVGPVYGADKWREYRAASVYVLPTHSENFGLTVAEALAAGTPAITTHGAPWSGLERERCGSWIAQGQDALVAALRELTSWEPHELSAAGARGRAWMLRDFGWNALVSELAGVYAWLHRGGVRPDCVRVD